jgi:hypothetical protein
MKRSVVSSDVFQRRIGNKAILFDDIPGYAPGYRILANILTVPRINLTLGLPSGSRAIDLVQFRRRYMGEMPRRIRVLRLSPPDRRQRQAAGRESEETSPSNVHESNVHDRSRGHIKPRRAKPLRQCAAKASAVTSSGTGPQDASRMA